MHIAPYLSFNGNCRQAFEFYEKALGGKIEFISTYGDSPMGEKTPPDQRDRVMHVSLKAGDFMVLGADAPPQYFSQPQGFSVCITLNDPAEADTVFNALAPGGKIQMPIQETFWAKRFGMLIDQFGTPWMVNCGQ